MSIYSNARIRQAIDTGQIMCHPFQPACVGYTSMYVTLGHYYYRIERASEQALYNPLDREDVERYFDGPRKALAHGEWCALNGIKPLHHIPLDHPVISLQPGERILAHTHEFCGSLPPAASEIRPLSVWTRNGLAISTGWLEPGQVNRLALEIHNFNARQTVLLPVGERIAQLVFHETGPIAAGDGSDATDAYQPSVDLDTIIRVWSPDMLLPKAYEASRSLPPKIKDLTYD